MIQVNNLKFAYRKKVVLDDISIELDNNMFILLGENGSGKTTFFRCLTGFYKRYQGTIKNLTDKSVTIGYLPQKFGCYKNFTVREVLEYIALLKDIKEPDKEVQKCIDDIGLKDIEEMKIKALSYGMLKRVGIAQAMLGSPDVVLLDEPTAGLDLRQKKEFYNVINRIKKDSTVIISTHILDDVRNIEGNILVLSDGKICFTDWDNNDPDLEEKFICFKNTD